MKWFKIVTIVVVTSGFSFAGKVVCKIKPTAADFKVAISRFRNLEIAIEDRVAAGQKALDIVRSLSNNHDAGRLEKFKSILKAEIKTLKNLCQGGFVVVAAPLPAGEGPVSTTEAAFEGDDTEWVDCNPEEDVEDIMGAMQEAMPDLRRGERNCSSPASDFDSVSE
ncbi:MAG: hypothetical protein V4534_02645 [Myxococcota bacterium]